MAFLCFYCSLKEKAIHPPAPPNLHICMRTQTHTEKETETENTEVQFYTNSFPKSQEGEQEG